MKAGLEKEGLAVVEPLVELCARHRPRVAVIGEARLEPALRDGLRFKGLPTIARSGVAALADVAEDPRSDTVIAAIVGAAGLLPTLAAEQAGSACCSPTRRRSSVPANC